MPQEKMQEDLITFGNSLMELNPILVGGAWPYDEGILTGEQHVLNDEKMIFEKIGDRYLA